MFEAHLYHESIISTAQEAFALHEKSHWGEKKGKKIVYTTLEALFLIEEKKMILKKAISPFLLKSFLNLPKEKTNISGQNTSSS